MFNIDWNTFVKVNIPEGWRTFVRLEWLKLIIYPVKVIYNEFTTFRDETIYDVIHTSQVIYLEKLLNDIFDPNNRQIYISLKSSVDQLFIFQPSENRPLYIYSEWDSSHNYQIGQFAQHNGRVWKCQQSHTNVEPTPSNTTEWLDYKKAVYLYQPSEYGVIGFIVNVPTSLAPIDEALMHRWIKKKKLAGVTYNIYYY